jgi:hypothetical protein
MLGVHLCLRQFGRIFALWRKNTAELIEYETVSKMPGNHSLFDHRYLQKVLAQSEYQTAMKESGPQGGRPCL